MRSARLLRPLRRGGLVAEGVQELVLDLGLGLFPRHGADELDRLFHLVDVAHAGRAGEQVQQQAEPPPERETPLEIIRRLFGYVATARHDLNSLLGAARPATSPWHP